MAFGVFDVIHPGHLRFLRAAKKLGAKLIVVVTRDAHVAKIKGRRPVMRESERLQIVAALRDVDRALLGDKGKPSMVRVHKPDIIAVGYDQDANHPKLLAQLASMKKKPKVVRIGAHRPAAYRSSVYKSKFKVSKH